MASNVFGSPIIDTTLQTMLEYEGKTTNSSDRVHVALLKKNAQGKDANARKYVEKLKEQFGDKGFASTLCLIYNATRDSITLINNHDWKGHLVASPCPVRIENRQWGAFFHKKTFGELGSSEIVVYCGINDGGKSYCWCVAWSTRWDTTVSTYKNKVYVEVHRADECRDDQWPRVQASLECSDLQHMAKPNQDGFYSVTSTGYGPTAILEALLTLDHL